MNRVGFGSVARAAVDCGGTSPRRAAPPVDLGPRGGFLAQMDLDFGGDDVATVYFEDDDSQDVKAGQGLAILRRRLFPPDRQLAVRNRQPASATSSSTTAAENADINMTRTLLQLEASVSLAERLLRGRRADAAHEPEARRRWLLRRHRFRRRHGIQSRNRLELDQRCTTPTSSYSRRDFIEDVDASHVGVRFTYRFGSSGPVRRT